MGPGTGEGAGASRPAARDGSTRPRSFPGHPSSARAARRFVRDELGPVGEMAGVAELLVSELATMVIRRSEQEFTVALEPTSAGVRVVIVDPSATATRPSDPATQSAVARGLRVVAALAQAWAVEPAQDGVRMWFELALRDVPQPRGAVRPPSALA